MQTLPGALWFNEAVGRDVMEELEREPADGLIVDCMLAAGLCAGQVSGVPTVALFHTPYSGFRAGPLVDMLAPSIGVLNTGRAGLGLGPVEGLADVHDACSLCIVAAPREFDVDMPLPSNVRYVGPMLAGPPLLAAADHV